MKRFASLAAAAALSAALLTGFAFAQDRGDGKPTQGSGSTAKDSAPATAEIGQPAPNFTLMDQDGNEVSLADFHGKVVVIEQFNQGCPYVVKFYREGHMNDLAKKYAEKGVVWLAIDSGNTATQEQHKKIADEWKMERPLLNDSKGDVGRAYGAKTTPQMRVINADGVLVYHGAIDSKPTPNTEDIETADQYLVKALDETLAGESVSQPETKPYGCSVKL